MTDRSFAWDDAALIEGLRGLGGDIDWPTATPSPGTPDLATRVRVAIHADAPQARRPINARSRGGWSWRVVRRPLLLALLALLALAAAAGAVGVGLPGLRIILGGATPPPTASTAPSRTPGIPGSGLGLGTTATLDAAAAALGRPLPLPADPALGVPDAVWIDENGPATQVALVWSPDGQLPATLDPDIGLLVMAFDGVVNEELALKILGSGTNLERVEVAGQRGFWIDGDPHVFFYESGGEFVEDGRRWVGDALIWTDGTTTYRMETSLGRDRALAIAATID